MLGFLKIENVALIDALEVGFAPGLNLLTGETGSGKSIIVDSLAALTGERVSSDIIKTGTSAARIEGIFTVTDKTIAALNPIFADAELDLDESNKNEVTVRREITATGRNRVFINDQMTTAGYLKKIGPLLADIHGQGEQASLFDPANHLAMLDDFARNDSLIDDVSKKYGALCVVKNELVSLKQDEAEKLQLLDALIFQVGELERAALKIGEEEELEEEKKKLSNVEKISTLATEAFSYLYEMDGSTVSTLDNALKRIEELAEYDANVQAHLEGIESAAVVLNEVSFTLRELTGHLEYSPERLAEIEDRLAEITRLSRKYGGTVETAIEHLKTSRTRLENIETAELREKELIAELALKRTAYIEAAAKLSSSRVAAAKKFEKQTEAALKDVALEKARFEVKIENEPEADTTFTANGFDRVEFYFSANVGEAAKPLAKTASGGEASRLMLILKTISQAEADGKTAVFDEIDAGIGGRVAEAVGTKLKNLAATQQVLCVTHQPQVASKADRHIVIEKSMTKDSTKISLKTLTSAERVEEIARMLAGERITDAARENAREMIASA